MSVVLINDEYLQDIADSIRKMKHKSNPITTDSMASEIEGIDVGYDVGEKWQRPVDWPDYSQIDISDFEGMYFTYDTTGAPSTTKWCGITCTVSGGFKVERGQIVNGEFVAEQSTNVATKGTFFEWIPYTISGYVVYKVSPQTAGAAITVMGITALTATQSGTGCTLIAYQQPILERYGRLPHVTSFSSWTNMYVISDTILDMAALTTMNSLWNNSYTIQNIDLTGFSSRPTTLYYAFRTCYSLKYLPDCNFVTSACTSMNSAFASCNSLREIDTTGWDTSNVTTMASCFSACTNLYRLDVSGFNTSACTSMAYMFEYVYKLKHIDVSGFDTSKCTSFAYMFRSAIRLEDLDVSHFNTEKVTSMTYMFSGCYCLEELDLSSFDTSAVTDMSYMFNACRGLKSLDIHTFDTSKVKNVSYMFDLCTSLSNVKFPAWDLSACVAFREWMNGALVIPSLDFSQANQTGAMSGSNCFTSAFQSCYGLSEVDLSEFDFTNCPANPSSAFAYDHCLETVILPESFTSMGTYFFRECTNLKKVVLLSPTVVTLASTNAFSTTPTTKTIYVPDALLDDYQAAANWSAITCVWKPLSEYTD